MRAKYREYGIDDEPYVVVKADAGTYGMGVMTVKSPDEVTRPQPQAAQQDGGGQGRPRGPRGHHPGRRADAARSVDGAVAEPVVYMMDRYVVGGFYRVHTERGRDENLNAPGMHFVPLAQTPFSGSCNLPDCTRPRRAERDQSLLRLRRGRAPGPAGRRDRARAHRRRARRRSRRRRRRQPRSRRAEAAACRMGLLDSSSSSIRSTRSRPTRIRAWR